MCIESNCAKDNPVKLNVVITSVFNVPESVAIDEADAKPAPSAFLNTSTVHAFADAASFLK